MRTRSYGASDDDLDEDADDLDQLRSLISKLESRRVLLAKRSPRDIEPLYLLLRRLRSSDSPSDWMFFRHLVRMTPDAFDSIVQLISVHSEFQNKNSKRLGASVEEQAAVVLYRFGRYGNGGGVVDVAYICGCAEGSVVAYTRR